MQRYAYAQKSIFVTHRCVTFAKCTSNLCNWFCLLIYMELVDRSLFFFLQTFAQELGWNSTFSVPSLVQQAAARCPVVCWKESKDPKRYGTIKTVLNKQSDVCIFCSKIRYKKVSPTPIPMSSWLLWPTFSLHLKIIGTKLVVIEG